MRSVRLSSIGVAVVASALAACAGPDGDPDPAPPGEDAASVVRVMTRNLYLGADLGPVIGTDDLDTLVARTGDVLRQVAATSFPVRVKGLAAEILEADPDLVGLQEVALWLTGPASLAPLLGGPGTATDVRLDFLALLLAELNAGEERYRPVVIQDQLDIEAPADENGIPCDGAVPIPDAELNTRLILRDVIIVRVPPGVEVSRPRGGTFEHLLEVPILGRSIPVTRGFTQVDARVRGGPLFRFINTHLEAYDPEDVRPSIRAQQAAELVAPGGPADTDLPVILVGDLNSDDDTVPPGRQQAYRVLLDAGFVPPGTDHVLTCCFESYALRTGSVAEIDRQIDHILTNAPARVQLVEAFATGLEMVNGYWSSDHAGLVAALRIR